jgi:hypothetical protein
MTISRKSLLSKVSILLGSATMLTAGPNDKPVHVAGVVAPWSMTITTNAVKVCPDRTLQTAAAFATNRAYSQGAIVQNASVRRFYMAVNAGTSGTNAPRHASGEASDGVITWRHFPSGFRNAVWLYNSGSNDVMFGIGYVPTLTSGGVLKSGGTALLDGMDVQGEIYAISPTGTLQGLEF